MVADALSQKPKDVIASLSLLRRALLRELDILQIQVIPPEDRSRLAALQLTSLLMKRIKAHQKEDPKSTKVSKK